MKYLLIMISCLLLSISVNAQTTVQSNYTNAEINAAILKARDSTITIKKHTQAEFDTTIAGVFPKGLKAPDGTPDSVIFIDNAGSVFIGNAFTVDRSPNSTGVYNFFAGSSAGVANTIGNSNTAIGVSALSSNDIGHENVGVGWLSLFSNKNYYNVGVGAYSLYSNILGSHNTAVGWSALYEDSSGLANTAIGSEALRYNKSGQHLVGVGQQSLYHNTTGIWNVGVGSWALISNTTGIKNTAIGSGALYSNVTGSHNTAVGYGALDFIESGDSNTAVGWNALERGGATAGTFSGNVALGANAGWWEDGSNNLYIDNTKRASKEDARIKALIYGTFAPTAEAQTLAINAQLTVSGNISGGVRTHKIISDSTLAASLMYGGVFYVTGAYTVTLPVVVVGMSATFITIGANAVSINPNDNDLQYLDGTALSDGDKATNASTAGDMIVFTYYDATGWYSASDGWTDGN